MEIGDVFVLVNNAPYSIWGKSKDKDVKFITVEVTELKENVRGEFSDRNDYKGAIGKGSDGYTYSYNYPTAHEGFSATPWTRYCTNEEFDSLSEEEKNLLIEDDVWRDVTNFDCFYPPKFSFDGLSYCNTHKRLFYTRSYCFRCKHNMKEKEMVDEKWLGWHE